MLFNRSIASFGALAAFAALQLAGPMSVQADCVPEWVEDRGLPPEFLTSVGPRVFGFTSFDDGTGETLYASGGFDVGPPDERTGGLRWTGDGWEALEVQGPDTFALSQKLVVYNGELYGAGGFRLPHPNWVENQLFRVARWDPDASNWVAVGDPASTISGLPFEAMVVFEGDLYVGGAHQGGHGLEYDNISRFDGENWTPPVPVLPASVVFDQVRDLIVYDDALYASFGDLFSAGRVYKQETLGEGWVQVGGVVPSTSKMAVFQGDLYIAGTNSQFLPALENHLFRLEDGEWVPVPSTTEFAFTFIEAMIAADDGSGEALYIAGTIEDIEGVENVNNIAKWDGENWSALGTGTHAEDDSTPRVNALYEWNNSLWVGGEFDLVGINDELIPAKGVAEWRCVATTVDPELSTVVAAQSAISSFAGLTRITVTPRDFNGDLLEPDQNVVLLTDGGTLVGSVADQGDGTYRQYLQGDTDSDGAEVHAVVNGVELDDRPVVSFVPVEPSLSTIDMSIAQTFIGGTATITVTLVDDEGLSAGSGFDVVIETTLGSLEGSVIDHGDGTYSQTIVATQTGTASITATVDGMTLNTSAALSVLDPGNIGDVVGVDADGNTVGFLSIQAAIDAAEEGGTVFISPGTYNETILLEDVNDLIIEGLSALEPVVLRGAILSDSNEVSLRNLTIDPDGASRPRHAVELRGGIRANSDVEIIGSTIVNASHNGISIGRDNHNVSIIDSVVEDNGRYGVDYGRDGEGHLILNSVISGNGRTGIDIDRDVVVRVENNLISDNGHFSNSPSPEGYGLAGPRQGGSGEPENITLIQNLFENNNGRTQNGRSDSDIRNFDQIIDESDDQSPYTD